MKDRTSVLEVVGATVQLTAPVTAFGGRELIRQTTGVDVGPVLPLVLGAGQSNAGLITLAAGNTLRKENLKKSSILPENKWII